jgi:predicted nucleic acid-binding Zn ribbon protein
MEATEMNRYDGTIEVLPEWLQQQREHAEAIDELKEVFELQRRKKRAEQMRLNITITLIVLLLVCLTLYSRC